MKKKNKIFLPMMVALILVSGISSVLASPTDIKLTVWKPSWGIDEKYLAPIFKKFEKNNPGVRIEYLFHPWEGLMERYTTAFMAGHPPDLFYLPDVHYPKLAASGLLAKLDEFFPQDIVKVKEEYIQRWWNSAIYKGHVYGIPYVHVGITLAYNKDLFDEGGIEYPAPMDDPKFSEWTWDKFVEVAQKLTIPEKDQWGYAWAANWAGDAEVWMYCYIWQAGAEIINEEGTGVGFDNKAGLTAFKFMNDLVNTYRVVPDGGMNPKFHDYFYTGHAAIAPFDCYQVTAMVKDYPELNIGITPYAQGPGRNLLDGRGMHANVGFWLMSNRCDYKDIAYKLMKFLTSKEYCEEYINAAGLFGCRKDYEMKIDNPKAQELGKIILAAAERYGHAYPINPHQIEVNPVFYAEVQNMVQQLKTPEQAWKDAVNRINEILKR